MSKKRFKFLSTDAFSKLSQREKLSYLSRAAAALRRTAATETGLHIEQGRPDGSRGTLGAVLYADRSKTTEPESYWIGLVRSVAAGNRLALHGLYERTHRLVFELIMRITGSRSTAGELTLDAFYDVWRRAPRYDAGNETVLGWIMNLARSKAADWLRHEQRKRVDPRASDPPPATGMGDGLRPAATLQRRLAQRIAAESGGGLVSLPATPQWREPEWEAVAPGISCKLLATDTDKRRVSMLVRLAPGADYPPHTHAGVEELHLLEGELWIEDRKLYPGDYNRAEAGTGDSRVWSETGCACVLITSTEDILS